MFENAIAAVGPPAAAELARRGPRRLLFHARPEPQAAAHMFELGVLALSRALERGAFARDWTLHGVGAVDAGRRLELGGGDWMQLLPPPARRATGAPARPRPRARADALAASRPRPDRDGLGRDAGGHEHVRGQDGRRAAAISPNLIAAEPTVEGIADALSGAAAAAGDVERRVRGADVRWSLDWDSSFDDRLLDRVTRSFGHEGRRRRAQPGRLRRGGRPVRRRCLPAPLADTGVEVRVWASSRVPRDAACTARSSRRPRIDRRLGGVDVVWLPAPAPVAVGAPYVLTIHDLSFIERPRDFTAYERLWHRMARVDALGVARRAW